MGRARHDRRERRRNMPGVRPAPFDLADQATGSMLAGLLRAAYDVWTDDEVHMTDDTRHISMPDDIRYAWFDIDRRHVSATVEPPGPSFIEIGLTLDHAKMACPIGRADEAVAALRALDYVRRQLDALDVATVKGALVGYGSWDDVELADHDENLDRLVWLAAGSIVDDADTV